MPKIPDFNSTEKKIRGLYDDLFGGIGADTPSKKTTASMPKTPAKPPLSMPSKAHTSSAGKSSIPSGSANTDTPPIGTDDLNSILQDLNKSLENDLSSMDKKKSSASAAPAKPEETEPDKEPEPETDPMDDLNSLIGLTSLKRDVEELVSLVKMQKLRQEQGLKSIPVSLHLVFSGNPGTGKTTVARILARLYKKIGVLSKGQLVEVDRSALVAGYVGQTATKTAEKINEAMGGILFIDEAYTLVKEGGNDFGQEAIDTLLKAMEDHRDGFVVIVAGYTELMEQFVNSNPGLKSRFNKYLFFPDYSSEDLFSIFQGMLAKYDYTLEDGADVMIKDEIQKLLDQKTENFANAREVRNLFEKIITRQAARIGRLDVAEVASEITIIRKEDIAPPSHEKD